MVLFACYVSFYCKCNKSHRHLYTEDNAPHIANNKNDSGWNKESRSDGADCAQPADSITIRQ